MDIKSHKAGIAPALCTQCSAQIEVDASLDAAICSHCGTAYVVEKAIAQYGVQEMKNTRIGHVETISIHHGSENKKTMSFFGRSLDGWVQVLLEREKRKTEATRLASEWEKRKMKNLPLVLIVTVPVFIGLLLAIG